MARGFESKAVADQQETAFERAPQVNEGPDPLLLARVRLLELSRADVKRRLVVAHAPAHREILARALGALDAEIASMR